MEETCFKNTGEGDTYSKSVCERVREREETEREMELTVKVFISDLH